MPDLGRLERVDLRDIWATEAQDFTPWLAQQENIQILSDAIGIDLEVEAQEKDVGPFRADILCKDGASESWVLIENQLERTDHGHLGQLLTYASGLHAMTIIWVAERFTEEHRTEKQPLLVIGHHLEYQRPFECHQQNRTNYDDEQRDEKPKYERTPCRRHSECPDKNAQENGPGYPAFGEGTDHLKCVSSDFSRRPAPDRCAAWLALAHWHASIPPARARANRSWRVLVSAGTTANTPLMPRTLHRDSAHESEKAEDHQ